MEYKECKTYVSTNKAIVLYYLSDFRSGHYLYYFHSLY